MIPTIYRNYYKPKMIKSTIRCHVCRSKPNILPSTLPWIGRNAATIFRLPRCLYYMKHHLINRINNFIRKCNNIPIYYMRKNYIKSNNPIPDSYKKFSRMTAKLPTSRTQLLRTTNYFIN